MKSVNETTSRPFEFIIHTICWGMFFGFSLFFTQRDNGTIDWNASLHHSLVPASFFVIFYINYFLYIPRILFRNHLKQFLLLNLLTILVFAVLLRAWHGIYMPPPPQQFRPTPPVFIFYLRDIASLVFTVGLSVAIRMSIRWSEAEAARREAVKSRMEAELKSLRNQLNPHFLLNTLNNIYALIAFDTDKAQQAVQELSRLLRYVLYDNQEKYVPLCKEVGFICNYIELMRIRVTEDVDIETHFDIKPDSQTPIAPLIFISLIENAFKHGISPTNHSFIHISLTEKDGQVNCVIRNSNYPKNENDKSGSGIGLEQVQKRLELLYPGRYKWECNLSEDQKEYYSSITITT